MLEQIADGRTDLVFEYVGAGNAADSEDAAGVSLIRHCAYYGDVCAIRFLEANGASLQALGANFDLGGACFHGHWQLCQFLIERGADVNHRSPDTGESPLHLAICRSDNRAMSHVVSVLLAAGAEVDARTVAGAETGSFMRDCRTRGETPLHRAAAFGDEATIGLLLEAGARRDAADANGDTPLTWASWHLRSTPILRQLCHGPHRVHPERKSLSAYLLGRPHL